MLSYWLPEEKEVYIQGACGPIQAGHVEGSDPKQGLVVCHPHPSHRGTMFNKVVTTVVKAGKASGFAVTGFNYRGVGTSAGHFADAVGEVEDALAVTRWHQQTSGCQTLWLVGFSFGAAIAFEAQAHVPTKGVVLICPSVERMSFTAQRTSPLFVIQAEQDEIVCPRSVERWVQKNKPVTYEKVASASHFFHGQLGTLRTLLIKIFEGSQGSKTNRAQDGHA